jgi:hypothetical protein
VFFLQSVHLYTQFYDLQIAIHRPFITPFKPSPHSFPSVAICANAARSCAHIIDRVSHRYPRRTVPFLIARPMAFFWRAGVPADAYAQRPAFISVIVLLLGTWNARRSNISINIDREMADVYKCISFMQGIEEHWNPAGRIVDVVSKLAEVGDMPLPQAEMRTKRPRERTEPAVTPNASTPSSSTLSSGGTPASHAPSPLAERAIAGSGRVRAAHVSRTENESMDSSATASLDGFGHMADGLVESITDAAPGGMAVDINGPATLPLRSSELGRMDADDPLLWDPSAFSFAAPFAPQAPPAPPDVQQMDSMFFQNQGAFDPAPGAGIGLMHDAPASNMDLGSLFGFGSDVQQPMVPPTAPLPPMDSVFGACTPMSGSIEELLQCFSAAPDGGGVNPDVWTGMPIECEHFPPFVILAVDGS